MSEKLQVRVISPWLEELETPYAKFSAKIQFEKADALLCDWAPDPALLTFPRRKAWYCCEPQCPFRALGGGEWPSMLSRMAPGEFLFHNHSDPRWRVPHVTHFENLKVNWRTDRKRQAVAVVSNHGGSPWRRHRDVGYRNRFVTHPRVDLYGRKGWMQYRASRVGRQAPPTNYKGELPGDWPDAAKRELMSDHQVAICLENMTEPYYFTEKFVEAVCAGCVPVYRAHPTVVQTVLRGATWVDPADHGHDPEATLEAAFSLDSEKVRQQNEQWLGSDLLAETRSCHVYGRIGRILAEM
jgi:hypothetical protein